MKKLIAILAAVALVFSFASCSKKDDAKSTTKSETAVNATVSEESVDNESVTDNDETTVPETVTTKDGETVVVTTKKGETTAKNSKTTTKKTSSKSTTKAPAKNTTAASKKVPSSKADILSCCNDALNKAKMSKAGYSKHYVMTVKGNVSGIPSWVTNIVKKNKDTKMDKGGKNIDDFPAAGYSWSSKLREQDISSATIKVNGNIYDIMVKLGTEKNPAKGTASSYGRVMSVIDSAGAKDMLSAIKTIDMTYHDGYIHVKVNSETGKLTYAEISASADIKANISVLGNIDVKDVVSTETFTNFVW